MSRVSGAAWIDGMRSVPVEDVARRLGAVVNLRSKHASPCPVCGRERRNGSTPGERRGALQLYGSRWHCFPCDVSGDAIDFVAFRIAGRRFRDLDSSRKRETREWCEGFLGIARGGFTSPVARAVPSRAQPLPADTPPPARDEVRAFFGGLASVLEDDEVMAYLRRRGIDATDVDDQRLAYALRRDAQAPSWAARQGTPWAASGHRLIVPLFDSSGEVASCVARYVPEGSPPMMKSLFPRGGRRGLVMACPFGRSLLRYGAPPPTAEGEPWWDPAAQLVVRITEGDSDFLTACAGASNRWRDADPHAPATFAIESGAWTPEIAARIPDGAHVIVATDDDSAGDKYAGRIAATFAGRRVTMERWRPRRA